MPKVEILPSDASHLSGLMQIAEETGLFPPDMLPEMIAAYLDESPAEQWLTCLLDGAVAGLCFARAEELTDGTWNMLALCVAPARQGQGIGTGIVSALEERLASEGARILIVDTSGTEAFARTRAFYAKNGYEAEARIRDYWADNDDKITFRKRLR